MRQHRSFKSGQLEMSERRTVMFARSRSERRGPVVANESSENLCLFSRRHGSDRDAVLIWMPATDLEVAFCSGTGRPCERGLQCERFEESFFDGNERHKGPMNSRRQIYAGHPVSYF